DNHCVVTIPSHAKPPVAIQQRQAVHYPHRRLDEVEREGAIVSRPRNLIVAQSGGPSPVINNSLRGLVETALDLPQIGTVYAGWHGIEGMLKEELLDLTAQPSEEIALLRTTPAAGSIGTCRYKLRPR